MDFKEYLNKGKEKMIPNKKKLVSHKHIVEHKRPIMDQDDDIITESQNMIDNLKNKVDAIFYRYGMNGLDKLDEAFIRCAKELMNPTAESVAPAQRPSTKKVAKAKAPKKIVEERVEEEPTADGFSDMEHFLGEALADEQKRADESYAARKAAFDKQQEYFRTHPEEAPAKPMSEATIDATKSTVSDDDLAALGEALV